MKLLRSLRHPEEVYALLRYWVGAGGNPFSKKEFSKNGASVQLKKCYEYLYKTSRSFAFVTQALHGELRDAICINYLVLRAVDTVEDDMAIPPDEKVTLLPKFHTFLYDPTWNYTKSRDKSRVVLEDFTTISSQFRLLKPHFRDIVSDVCLQMGAGMTIHLTKSPDTIQQWDEYCHVGCGIPAIGFSRMFSASGLEDKMVDEDFILSNSVGLFLQKVNTVRDYLDDVTQGRQLWPKEVWCKYSRELTELAEPERIDDAICCLNELITCALLHVPDVMKFLSRIQSQSIFNFWAIMQVIGVATLERCYNNRQVFRGIVKIRKGETVWLMTQVSSIDNVKAAFVYYLKQMELKIPYTDPSAHATRQMIEVALNSCVATHV